MPEPVIPATLYNRIKLFENQQVFMPIAKLKKIGTVFIHYDMHNDYGAAILHRHHDLRHNYVMIHADLTQPGDSCVSTPLSDVGTSPLFPHSLYLESDGSFRPYEYDRAPPRKHLQPDFLQALRETIVEEKLGDTFALVRAPNSGLRETIEYLLPGDDGTISLLKEFDHGRHGDHGDSIMAQWVFRRTESGDIDCIGVRKCERLKSGLHKVINEQNLTKLRSLLD